jgi:pyruvate kinase
LEPQQELIVSSSDRYDSQAVGDKSASGSIAAKHVVGRLVGLRDDIDRLLTGLSHAETVWSQWSAAVAAEHESSARNLVHYWAIRQTDLRDLQSGLADFGLPSLGRSEAHVEATLLLVRSAIVAMLGGGWQPPESPAVQIDQGPRLLRQRTVDLLGPAPTGRMTRIMVTLPSEAAWEAGLVRGLVERGMNVARINCAHDDPEAWRAMARHVRQAAESIGKTCLIAMDLAGPKLRTGPLQPGPRSVKLRPHKNIVGEVTAPATAWLTPAEDPLGAPRPGVVSIPVPHQWLSRRRVGEVLRLRDARGASRCLLLRAADEKHGVRTAFTLEAAKTTYLTTGTLLHVDGRDDPVQVGELPETEQSLLLRRGDILELTRDCSPAVVNNEGVARIGCTLPEIFDNARVGETVLIDDGRIGGQIVEVGPERLAIQIDHAAKTGSKLRAGKGINVPDTRLPISALTDKDIADLATVVELADIVEMSFVRDPSDVEQLLARLEQLGADSIGIILKIETQQAFEHLPQLLLTVMRWPCCGVMIARGDLAVECGYERLAELQEEILWLCEAGHLPVVWATQVLDQLAKTGNPSRAEVSDAAMSERAECAMLNKGPYINEAVAALDNILRRMSEHHYKKSALLRSLHSWQPGAADTNVASP